VIASFADSATEALFHGDRSRSRRIPPTIRAAAVRKLDMLNAAHTLEDMKVPPGNRLEALKGDLVGMHSVRVNRQWRVIFRWEGNNAHDVAIVDYH
jgi:toxin HigB-1